VLCQLSGRAAHLFLNFVAANRYLIYRDYREAIHFGREAMQIAIIGAGFSGCQLALELLRHGTPGIQILLFDGSGTFGPGLAFAARHHRLLLNTRVAHMSAFEGDEQHLLRWLRQTLPGDPTGQVPTAGDAFISRGLYGRYLTKLLDAAATTTPGRVSLSRIASNVVGLIEEPDRLRLTLADGSERAADVAILCTGVLPPQLPDAPGVETCHGARFIANPWHEASIARIGRDDAVLVLGSGLTMVDVAILLADFGHEGPILALSRRGLLPRVHAPFRPWAQLASPVDAPPTALALVRHVRREIARAEDAGVEWHSVIDALRPHVQALWRGLPRAERRRFLRHVRAYWDVHRHRMAPEIALRIDDMRRSGQLEIRAGAIESYQALPEGLAVRFRPRGKGIQTRIVADWLINCAGPALDFRRVPDPLVRALLRDGTIQPDVIGVGLAVTQELQLVRADGRPHHRLFALGPLTKGAFGEATAIPDVRRHGQRLAARLVQRASALAA
jgi:uncharacterized NAD(P)/FAD-binding protein YdhS